MTALIQTDNTSNIKLVKTIAQNVYPDNTVLRDLTICQAILEAGLTRRQPSLLAYKYNNLFGIKGNGTKGHVTMPTHEYIHNEWVEVDAIFAYNASVEDSIEQHRQLLNMPRYVDLQVAKTIEEAATWIVEDGYCTDPSYTTKLLDIYCQYIEEDN